MKPVRKDVPVLHLSLDPLNPRLEDGVDNSVTAINEIPSVSMSRETPPIHQ